MRKFSVVISLIMVTSLSCDPEFQSRLVIENSSEYIIEVGLFYEGATDSINFFSLKIGHSYTFWEEGGMGGYLIYSPSELNIDSMHFSSPGVFSKGFTINTEGRNPFDLDDYVIDYKNRLRSAIFIITDEDIENWK